MYEHAMITCSAVFFCGGNILLFDYTEKKCVSYLGVFCTNSEINSLFGYFSFYFTTVKIFKYSGATRKYLSMQNRFQTLLTRFLVVFVYIYKRSLDLTI